jgi:hypothetical protein
MNKQFSDKVERVLRDAGWFPGRNIGDLVLKWKQELMVSDGFEMFPKAEEALSEFGGLLVNQNGPGITCARESFHILPTLAIDEADRFSVFSDYLQTKLYPLGEAVVGHGFRAIGEDGRVFLVEQDIMLNGNNMDEALEHLILGIQSEEI